MNANAWVCAAAAAILVPGPIAAAGAAEGDYPSRPIRIIVPQSPGASTDLTARLIAQKLGEAFRQTVIVDNRPGSSGIAGSEIVARSAPDGYTLMVVASSFSINPALGRKLPYDSLKDFTAVSQLSKFPNMMAAYPSAPVKTLPDVITLAKAKPGQLAYASAGVATGTHMSAELLKYMTGINLLHVPYKGGGPAATATMGGETQLVVGHLGRPAAARESRQAEGDRDHQRKALRRGAGHSHLRRVGPRLRARAVERSFRPGRVAEAAARPGQCRGGPHTPDAGYEKDLRAGGRRRRGEQPGGVCGSPEGGNREMDEGRQRGGNQSRVRHRAVRRALNQPTPGALTRPRRKA